MLSEVGEWLIYGKREKDQKQNGCGIFQGVMPDILLSNREKLQLEGLYISRVPKVF